MLYQVLALVLVGFVCRIQNTGDLCGCCNMSERKHFWKEKFEEAMWYH